jgi:hypothetical protein
MKRIKIKTKKAYKLYFKTIRLIKIRLIFLLFNNKMRWILYSMQTNLMIHRQRKKTNQPGILKNNNIRFLTKTA